MKYTERVVRNEIVVNLSKLVPLSQEMIGRVVGISQKMVSKILLKEAQNSPLTTKSTGSKRKISAEQLSELAKFLGRGAEFYGFTGAYWTHKRVAYVIEKEYGIVYSLKQTGRILDLIGWTRQIPQKKDKQQDLEKVAKWQGEALANLKKKQ